MFEKMKLKYITLPILEDQGRFVFELNIATVMPYSSGSLCSPLLMAPVYLFSMLGRCRLVLDALYVSSLSFVDAISGQGVNVGLHCLP